MNDPTATVPLGYMFRVLGRPDDVMADGQLQTVWVVGVLRAGLPGDKPLEAIGVMTDRPILKGVQAMADLLVSGVDDMMRERMAQVASNPIEPLETAAQSEKSGSTLPQVELSPACSTWESFVSDGWPAVWTETPMHPVGSYRWGPNGLEVYLHVVPPPAPESRVVVFSCDTSGPGLLAAVRGAIRKHEEQTGRRPDRMTMPADQFRRFLDHCRHVWPLRGDTMPDVSNMLFEGVEIEADKSVPESCPGEEAAPDANSPR